MPELTIRYKKSKVENTQITHSSDAARVLRKMFDADTLEYFETSLVIYLDRANQTLAYQKIGMGGMTGVVMDPRVVFATALKIGATGIILSHNHPSGTLTPSTEDAKVTQKFIDGGKILGIRVFDHIIITADSYYSFADQGQI